jgi:hypothetical protein
MDGKILNDLLDRLSFLIRGYGFGLVEAEKQTNSAGPGRELSTGFRGCRDLFKSALLPLERRSNGWIAFSILLLGSQSANIKDSNVLVPPFLPLSHDSWV